MNNDKLIIEEALKKLKEIDDDEVFEEKQEIKEELLNEESLNRISIHLDKGRPFAMISACRGVDKKNPTQEEIDAQNKLNEKNSKQLERSILTHGFGFNRLNGVSYETDLDGNERETYETSYVVYTPEINRKWETRLYIFCEMQGRKYNQDTVLFFGMDKLGMYISTKRDFDDKPYYDYGTETYYDEDDKEKYAFSKLQVGKASNYTHLPKDKRDFTLVQDKKELDKERDKRYIELNKKRTDIINKFIQKKNYKSVSIDEGIESGVRSVRIFAGGLPAMGVYHNRNKEFNECWDDETDTADEKKLKEFIDRYYR